MYKKSQWRDAVKIHLQKVSRERCCKDICTNSLKEEMFCNYSEEAMFCSLCYNLTIYIEFICLQAYVLYWGTWMILILLTSVNTFKCPYLKWKRFKDHWIISIITANLILYFVLIWSLILYCYWYNQCILTSCLLYDLHDLVLMSL